MITVTKTFLPKIDDYIEFLHGIWERNWLTNNGPVVNELEMQLKKYLGVNHLLFLSNGTIAIQIAIKALNLTGEIITTPFSYVATTSSIVWEGCKPVFADIDVNSLNIDPKKIEEKINENTSAILATHVYGNPCDIDAIQAIATKHNLKVIYDAAHAFGVKYKGKSIFDFGDISTTSFHATKIFHTIEGGAVTTTQPKLLEAMARHRNFGHATPDTFDGVGINGKNSEFHAAMGVVNLKYMDDILATRKRQSLYYNQALQHLRVVKPAINKDAEWNYSYYPIIFESETHLLKSLSLLNDNWIYPRRYFYPSLSALNYVEHSNVPISEDISRRVMCLPLYHTLKIEEIDFIARILLRVQNN